MFYNQKMIPIFGELSQARVPLAKPYQIDIQLSTTFSPARSISGAVPFSICL